MSTSWKAATLEALTRFAARHRSAQVSRSEFLEEELPSIVVATKSMGRTPAQTVSRVLQELRDEGTLFFSSAGVYVLNSPSLDVTREDFPDDVLEYAIGRDSLVLADVPTADSLGQARVRRGMAAVRRSVLLNYGGQCAVCDVADPQLLVASHVARWADRPEARGRLSNVICLCRLHDPLFELGYFGLSDELALVWKPTIASSTIRNICATCTTTFRLPPSNSPDVAYLREHRTRSGFQ